MDKTIMLWDVSSGNWTRKWRGHQVIVIMIMTGIMILISLGGCQLRLIQRGQQPSDQRQCGHHSQDLGHQVQGTGEPIRGHKTKNEPIRKKTGSDDYYLQDPIQTMEECKDSVTSLDISDHEILVGSADSR